MRVVGPSGGCSAAMVPVKCARQASGNDRRPHRLTKTEFTTNKRQPIVPKSACVAVSR